MAQPALLNNPAPHSEIETLIGHEWAAELLQSAIDSSKVSHAYIFRGPTGIGKSLLAHHFALALCCERPPARSEDGASPGLRFCGTCRPCRLISNDKHPDVTVVGLEWQARNGDGASSNANLKIDTVRAVQLEISRAPTEAPWRIFIVEDAATMQPAAANAFLKTLEEPPARAILILIADSDRPLLSTITSRCQQFDLRSVPTAEIEQALLDLEATPAEAGKLAALAVGRPGYALRAFFDKTQADLNDRDEALMHHNDLLSADRAARLLFAEELTSRWQAQGEKRASVLLVLNLWLGWWRDLALLKNGQEEFVTNRDKLEDLRKQAERVSLLQIKEMLLGLTRCVDELESNVSPRLALGDLFINKLPRIKPRGGE
ncbi:MAG TPA: DNA polymerase III subunit [Chloroflexia bacterium]|nr:DNA polymerase III subunit [Chloroflexia bacterium]